MSKRNIRSVAVAAARGRDPPVRGELLLPSAPHATAAVAGSARAVAPTLSKHRSRSPVSQAPCRPAPSLAPGPVLLAAAATRCPTRLHSASSEMKGLWRPDRRGANAQLHASTRAGGRLERV
eukprot:5722945-Prymnesium_polylepis.1